MWKEVDRTESGILAQLWRMIVFESGLDNIIKKLLEDYHLRNPDKNKASVKNDIYSTSLSWKKFIFLIFHILKAKKIRLTVEVTHSDNTVTTHSIEVYPNIQNKKDKTNKKEKSDES